VLYIKKIIIALKKNNLKIVLKMSLNPKEIIINYVQIVFLMFL